MILKPPPGQDRPVGADQLGVRRGQRQIVEDRFGRRFLVQAGRVQALFDLFDHLVGCEISRQRVDRELGAHRPLDLGEAMLANLGDHLVGVLVVINREVNRSEVGVAEGVVDRRDFAGRDAALALLQIVFELVDAELHLVQVVLAGVVDLADHVVPGEQAEPVAHQQEDEDGEDDGEEDARAAVADDLLGDVEEGLVDHLDDILDAARHQRLLGVAGAPPDEERADEQEEDHDPGGEDRVGDFVAADVGDQFGGDRDDGFGRANEEEPADDQHQCAEDDQAALGHSSHSCSSCSAVLPRGLRVRRSGCSSTSSSMR